MRRRRLLRILMLALIPAALLVPARAATANHLCGFVVTAPGTYVLPHDLTCPTGDAIEVDADDVTIDLNGFRVIGQGNPDIGINVRPDSDNVVIENGTVRGFDVGIEVGNCSGIVGLGFVNNVTISGVTVRGSSADGIRICETDGTNAITGTAIVNSGDRGIELLGPGTIFESVVRDAAAGIRLELATVSGDSVTIDESLVEEVSTTGVEMTGIHSTGGPVTVDVRDTMIQDASRGITASGAVHPDIRRTTIQDTNNEAIWLKAATDPGFEAGYNIQRSLIQRAGGGVAPAAIVVQDRPGAGAIVSTVVQDVTDGAGIMAVCSTTFMTVRNSLVRRADGDGVLISDASSVAGLACQPGTTPDAIFLIGNAVKRNGANGAAFYTGDAHSLENNVFVSNTFDGVWIDDDIGQTPPLTENRSRLNGGDGFHLDTSDLALTANVARSNTGYGFRTTFKGPVAVDNGQTTVGNVLGQCSDPNDLPNTVC